MSYSQTKIFFVYCRLCRMSTLSHISLLFEELSIKKFVYVSIRHVHAGRNTDTIAIRRYYLLCSHNISKQSIKPKRFRNNKPNESKRFTFNCLPQKVLTNRLIAQLNILFRTLITCFAHNLLNYCIDNFKAVFQILDYLTY